MPPRILIVDDSALVRKFLQTCLETESGWQVCGEAGNGEEAIEKAKELQPDLIVLDLSMPVMNGLETAKALSKLVPSVPLIMYTTFHTRHLENEAQAAGISRVILKSEPLTNLIACVRSLTQEVAGPEVISLL
jgi:DNA-binding NarL/FixJ family response regulator